MGKNILIATVGDEYHVVLETLIALLHGCDRAGGWPKGTAPDEIHLLFTRHTFRHGARGINEHIAGCLRAWKLEVKPQIHQYLLNGTGRFDTGQPTRDGDGPYTYSAGDLDLSDLRTIVQCAAADSCTCWLLAQITRSNVGGRVHASIAGGRKTMSADLASAMYLFMGPNDSVSHVLLDGAPTDASADLKAMNYLANCPEALGINLIPRRRPGLWQLLRQDVLRALILDDGQWSQDRRPESLAAGSHQPLPLQRLQDYIDAEVILNAGLRAAENRYQPLAIDVTVQGTSAAGATVRLFGRQLRLPDGGPERALLLASLWWWANKGPGIGVPVFSNPGQFEQVERGARREFALVLFAILADLEPEDGKRGASAIKPALLMVESEALRAGRGSGKSLSDEMVQSSWGPLIKRIDVDKTLSDDDFNQVAVDKFLRDKSSAFSHVRTCLSSQLLFPDSTLIPDERAAGALNCGQSGLRLQHAGQQPEIWLVSWTDTAEPGGKAWTLSGILARGKEKLVEELRYRASLSRKAGSIDWAKFRKHLYKGKQGGSAAGAGAEPDDIGE